jgi:hypothetical protein
MSDDTIAMVVLIAFIALMSIVELRAEIKWRRENK